MPSGGWREGGVGAGAVDLLVGVDGFVFGREVEAVGEAVHVSEGGRLEDDLQGAGIAEEFAELVIIGAGDLGGSARELAGVGDGGEFARAELGIVLTQGQEPGRSEALAAEASDLVEGAVAAAVGH